MRALGAIAVLLSGAAGADELPVSLQAQLLQKTASYITSLTPLADGGVKLVVLYPGAAVSRSAEAIVTAVNQLGTLGRFKAEAKPASLSALKATLDAEKPQLLWLTAELDEAAVQQVREAVGTSSVVTVSPSAAHVRLGVILGFELVEAKPRILVHLKQARAQNVVFLSGLLTHSVIVEK